MKLWNLKRYFFHLTFLKELQLKFQIEKSTPGVISFGLTFKHQEIRSKSGECDADSMVIIKLQIE